MIKRLLLAVALSCALASAQKQPLQQPHWSFVDASGNPCAGCKLYTYLAGTTTPTPTYTDAFGTFVNTNPIVLDVSGGANIWYGPASLKVILKDADGVTLWSADHIPFNSGGGGGIVSAGNLPPLFTTNVAGSNLTFAQINAGPLTMFGNPNGLSHVPTFFQYTCTGLLTCTFDSGSNTLTFDVPTSSALSIAAVSPILVNGGAGPVDSGLATISCPDCAQPINPLLTPPTTGDYVILTPTSATMTSSGACTSAGVFPVYDNNSALLGLIPQASGFPPSNCQVIWGFAGALTAQHPEVTAGSITAVYATGVTSWGVGIGVGSPTITVSPGSMAYGPSPTLPSWPLQQSTSGVTAITGANIETATITALLSRSGTSAVNTSLYTINSPSLFVFYSGSPQPATNAIYLESPLKKTIDANGNQVIGIDKNYPQWLIPQTLAQANAGFPIYGQRGELVVINDASSPGVCTGGGTSYAVCQSDGTTWQAIGGGATSGTYFTETLTCTTTCTLTHTPMSFQNLSVNGLVMVSGTDFTRSGTTVTLTTPAVGGDVFYAQYYY